MSMLPPSPPPVSVAAAGHFTWHSQKLSWPDAEAYCVSNGGHLASIRTIEENYQVLSLCSSSGSTTSTDGCWIGFNDIAVETEWRWTDGWPANFSAFPNGVAPWQLGEPNGLASENTDGAYMYPLNNNGVVPGAWDDTALTQLKAFVCRAPPAPPTPPPPTPPPHSLVDGPFELNTLPSTASDAEAYCVSRHGHLASIRSFAENLRVLHLCFPNECWIGFTKVASAWGWMDGYPSSFPATTVVSGRPVANWPNGEAPWSPGEPNGMEPNGYHAYVQPGRGGHGNQWAWPGSWDDDEDHATRPFVCRLPERPPSPSPPPPSPSPPHPTISGPFHVFDGPMNYNNAEAHCQTMNMHLASIQNEEENNVVLQLTNPVAAANPTFPTAEHPAPPHMGGGAGCWIGYNDRDTETEWGWTDGSTTNWTANFPGFNGNPPWRPGEPNGQAQEATDGAYMYASARNGQWVRAGTWDDTDIAQARCFVCRVPLNSPPSPPPGSGSGGGGGGGAGTVFLVLFLLALAGGGGYWVHRQKQNGEPIVPDAIANRVRVLMGGRARTGSSTMVRIEDPIASAPLPEYTPPAVMSHA